MQSGARSPEELETLLEDALLGGEHDAVSALFADGAVLAHAGIAVHARGSQQIAREAAALCEAELAYVASPKRVLQARNTVLVIAEQAINVAVRGDDRAWRYAIAVLDINHKHEEQQQ